jgi:hypothetical protein
MQSNCRIRARGSLADVFGNVLVFGTRSEIAVSRVDARLDGIVEIVL